MTQIQINSHGLVQTLKLYFDSLDLEQFKREMKDNPYLRDIARAINYER